MVSNVQLLSPTQQYQKYEGDNNYNSKKGTVTQSF
jgi:hypothetical protein